VGGEGELTTDWGGNSAGSLGQRGVSSPGWDYRGMNRLGGKGARGSCVVALELGRWYAGKPRSENAGLAKGKPNGGQKVVFDSKIVG